jgi:hypothetical protein
MPGNCGRVEPMCCHGNESHEREDLTFRVAYTKRAEGAAPAKPAVPPKMFRIP